MSPTRTIFLWSRIHHDTFSATELLNQIVKCDHHKILRYIAAAFSHHKITNTKCTLQPLLFTTQSAYLFPCLTPVHIYRHMIFIHVFLWMMHLLCLGLYDCSMITSVLAMLFMTTSLDVTLRNAHFCIILKIFYVTHG
jgi:hypothetical protein